MNLNNHTSADRNTCAAKACALRAPLVVPSAHTSDPASPLQGNQAQQLGGGLAVAQSPGARVVLRSGTFTENAAGLGGGLHADNETEASAVTFVHDRSMPAGQQRNVMLAPLQAICMCNGAPTQAQRSTAALLAQLAGHLSALWIPKVTP